MINMKEVGEIMTTRELYQIIEEEGLDKDLITSTAMDYGLIKFYRGNPGEYYVKINGERDPLLEYNKISEDEACRIVLKLLRDAPRKKTR